MSLMSTTSETEGSKGYLKEEREEVLTATKQFNSGAALSSFLSDPLTAKLYKVLYVDHTTKRVKVECLPLQQVAAKEVIQ